jgi:RHS repeat-associated protein
MADNLGLVHMHGRMYDPVLGRFLSPDPIIPTIALTQALNPFSYVMNNPLKLVDPTGYSWLSDLWDGVKKFFRRFWRPIVAIVAAVFTFGVTSAFLAAHTAVSATMATAYAGAAAGLVSGGLMNGLDGALIGMVSGFTFVWGNALWSNVGSNFVQGAGIALTAGIIGGASSEGMGGEFRHGFWFAFGASAASSIYQSVVRYRATWASGGDAVTKLESAPPVEGANNIGTQGRTVSEAGFWSEGGSLSRLVNRVPGINAIAGLHDEFITHLYGSWRTILNVPTMLPAAAVTMAALSVSGPIQLTYNYLELEE